jgi:hypothetical protein
MSPSWRWTMFVNVAFAVKRRSCSATGQPAVSGASASASGRAIGVPVALSTSSRFASSDPLRASHETRKAAVPRALPLTNWRVSPGGDAQRATQAGRMAGRCGRGTRRAHISGG